MSKLKEKLSGGFIGSFHHNRITARTPEFVIIGRLENTINKISIHD